PALAAGDARPRGSGHDPAVYAAVRRAAQGRLLRRSSARDALRQASLAGARPGAHNLRGVPELPEVETIRRQLAPLVEGRRLERVEILDERWSRPLAPSELAAALEGRRVQALRRRGKYLLWELDEEIYLAQHLRMTGAVLYDPDP